MELILLQDVENLGRRGAIVKVARGYARNYLLPRGVAIPVTAKNRAAVQAELERTTARRDRLREGAEAEAARLAEAALSFEKLCNEEGELYGSVTATEVATALAALGFDVDKKNVSFDEPISHIGMFTARVRFADGVEGTVPITVVKPEA
ncbi:MAG: 50S ribosomal protein L9 [Candidatus Coatesbacteria bacterium]|nr:MAG: 50S ribosomal protein L9 [Candidatus Coatesbacteria bacterium]